MTGERGVHGLAAATWFLRMVQEDERDRQVAAAQTHGLLVEGVAMALRAQSDAVIRYIKDYRDAEWVTAPQGAPPEAATIDLLSHPLFSAIAQAAANAGQPQAAPAPTPAPAPVFRVRRIGRGG